MSEPGLLYHRSQSLFQPGERVSPGQWGRKILGTGPVHPAYYREYVFEKIRGLEFPDKPSRMTAAFALADATFAMGWQRGQVAEYVYAVRLADPASNTHRGDMSWVDVLPQYRTFSALEECIRRYWRGEERGPEKIEILAPCELIVEGRLTKIPDNGFELAP